MTPTQTTAPALADYEHPESGFAGPVNSTAPAASYPQYSYAEDEDWDLRPHLVTERPPTSPIRHSIFLKSLTERPRDEEATTSSFTAKRSSREGGGRDSGLAAVFTRQRASVSIPEVRGRRLADASTVDDVLDVLRDYGHTALAGEIDELISRLADEPDEPAPNTESLKLLARAAFGEGSLRAPRSLALTKEGYLHAEWYLGQAKLFMTFLPTAHIRVVAIHPGTGGDDVLHVAGSLYSPNTESFAKWLASSLLK